jgi:hypothetical protein
MRAYTNEPFIKRRGKLGQYISWGGLAILGIGMLLSLRSDPGSLRVNTELSAMARTVARDQSAIGFWDFTEFQQVADQLRTVAVDGVLPNAETTASGAYPLITDSGALVIVVSPQNTWLPESGLTQAQVAKVFSGDQYRWSAIDPTWPNTAIKRQGPNTQSAAYAAFLAGVMEPVYGDQAEQALLGASNPSYQMLLIASFGCLILGFIAANIGGYNTRRFGRSPRPDERLAHELKGFDDRYMLFNWLLPAPYVFAGPSGIYTIALREQAGQVTNIGSKWKQPFSIARIFLAFSSEGVGNPTLDSQQDARKMQQYLAKHIPDLDVEVQPLVLFTNPKAVLELKNPDVPVLTPQGLKALFRQRKKDAHLTTQRLEELQKLFTSTAK